MDPTKVCAVLDLPVPDTRKQLQWFLGFNNFNRRFVRNYTLVVAPLTALTSVKKPFLLSTEPNAVFRLLKERFTSALILCIRCI